MPQNQTIRQIRGEFCIETRPQPCALVIFGASGDLTRRKLIPSLYHLFQRKLLSRNFYILGCARTPLDDAAFRSQCREGLARESGGGSGQDRGGFLERCYYLAGDYDKPEFYQQIAARLTELDQAYQSGENHLFYLATPPNLDTTIAWQLGRATLTKEFPGGPWRRVVLEKPLGRDLESALALDDHLHAVLAERQIYRIDHYLGKETVQNLLMLRFANAIFEPIWNRRYIDHVQITVAENLGIEHRAGYFEQAGTLRDMFQNHMLQMLSLVAMEPPASFDANRVRDEKVKLLRSIRPFPTDPAQLEQIFVRGQYGAGTQGVPATPSYREEPGVAPDSPVETFVACELRVDNWRWQGVPFYLRTGKRLAAKASQIAIVFKAVPHSMFQPIESEDLAPNVLVLNVQPNEGASLTLQAKHPGPKLCMSSLTMDFTYSEVFGEDPPEAYERLLLDCMLGDPTLFVRSDDMEVSWALITPLLETWRAQGEAGRIDPYPPGSWGPAAADALLARDGRQWLQP